MALSYGDKAAVSYTGGNGSNTYAAMPNAARETDVTAQLGLQEKLVVELLDLAKQLEQSLLSVLREHGPTLDVNPTPEPPLVPLASTIKSNNERITAALGTIDSILKRLEL